jgi:cystathionine beta-lyase family protein involved in aluminum resistance
MYQELGISERVINLVNKCEEELKEEFKKIDEKTSINSLKVLNAFHKNNVSESCFNETTGYGF